MHIILYVCLQGRELEMNVLRDRLKQQESMGKQLADKIRSEANIKVSFTNMMRWSQGNCYLTILQKYNLRVKVLGFIFEATAAKYQLNLK